MRHVRMRALLRSCIALTTAAVGLASTQALADAAFADGFKRSSLQLHERTSEGQPIGCEITFITTGSDDYYRQPPGTVIVFGSYFFFPQRVFADGLKICGLDVSDVGEVESSFDINYAYPIVFNKSLAKAEHSSTVVDECIISFYEANNSIHFSDMKIAYSRKAGGRDVMVDFVWDSSSYRDVLQTQLEFVECAQRTLAAMK